MMSLEYMDQLAREAAAKARRAGREPHLILEWGAKTREQRINEVRNLPNIGDYRPPGWFLDAVVLVDKSGMGSPHELALNLDGFLEWMETGQGYAIIEEGQFQVVIGAFNCGRAPKGHRVFYDRGTIVPAKDLITGKYRETR